VDVKKERAERGELIEIFDNLSTPLKEQLITIARVIRSTHEITLIEKSKRKKQRVNNES
jgi:hypothetical protein